MAVMVAQRRASEHQHKEKLSPKHPMREGKRFTSWGSHHGVSPTTMTKLLL